MSALSPLCRRLPYWATRTFEVGGSPFAILVLVDGTLVVGFSVRGVDVASREDGDINQRASQLERALNLLPAGSFLQADFEAGLGFEDVLDDYQRRGRAGPPLCLLQRQHRAAALRADGQLRRGQISFWVGIKGALGQLREDGLSPFGRLLGAVLGQAAAARSEVTEAMLERGAQDLAALAANVQSSFEAAGLVLRRFDEAQILRSLHRAINPRSANTIGPPLVLEERQSYGPSELETGESYLRALTLREQLPLGDLVWAENHFQLDDPPLLHRALSVQRLPALSTPLFLQAPQLALAGSFRLSITLQARDAEASIGKLILRRNRMAAQAAGQVRNVGAELALREHEALLERLIEADQRLFSASAIAVASATNHEQLSRRVRILKETFSGQGAALTCESGRQLGAAIASLPAAGTLAPTTHTVPTRVASDLLPWTGAEQGADEAEFLYHTREGTLRKVSFSAAGHRQNRNVLVFGGSGSGKTFNVTTLLQQCGLAEGSPVTIVDVQGAEVSNYKGLTEVFGGTYVALGGDGDIAFNPFFSHREIFTFKERPGGIKAAIDEEKVGFCVRLLLVICLDERTDLADERQALMVLRRVVLLTYQRTRASNRTPLLRDIKEQLSDFEAEEPEHVELARRLYLNLSAFLSDRRRALLLDRPTSHRGRSLLCVYDFFGLEKDPLLSTVLLLSVSFHIWSELGRRSREQVKFVVFDECWKLLRHPIASSIVSELFRTGRKWGASTWAVTQDLNDFLDAPCSSALLANSQTLFLNQHAGRHQEVARLCGLNERQLQLFENLSFKKGAYAELLLVDRTIGDAAAVRLVPTPFDLWLNTSDPADLAFRSAERLRRGLSLEQVISVLAQEYPQGAPSQRPTQQPAALRSPKNATPS